MVTTVGHDEASGTMPLVKCATSAPIARSAAGAMHLDPHHPRHVTGRRDDADVWREGHDRCRSD